jgi:hypothetical protein
MPAEHNTEQDYRAAYIVGGGFLIAYALITLAVANDATHRSALEQVITLDQVSGK